MFGHHDIPQSGHYCDTAQAGQRGTPRARPHDTPQARHHDTSQAGDQDTPRTGRTLWRTIIQTLWHRKGKKLWHATAGHHDAPQAEHRDSSHVGHCDNYNFRIAGDVCIKWKQQKTTNRFCSAVVSKHILRHEELYCFIFSHISEFQPKRNQHLLRSAWDLWSRSLILTQTRLWIIDAPSKAIATTLQRPNLNTTKNRPCFRRSFPKRFWAKRKSFVLYFSMHWNCNTTKNPTLFRSTTQSSMNTYIWHWRLHCHCHLHWHSRWAWRRIKKNRSNCNCNNNRAMAMATAIATRLPITTTPGYYYLNHHYFHHKC